MTTTLTREQSAELVQVAQDEGRGQRRDRASWLTSVGRLSEVVIAVLALVISVQQFRQDSVQASMASILFTREYINGYVYLYDITDREKVIENVRDLRKAGLPAIAVPSQFSPDAWLIVSHTRGDFPSAEAAEKEILHWRRMLEEWEVSNKTKTAAFARHENHLRQERGYKDRLVFLYKPDIINHGRYFRRLARSADLLVEP